MLYMRSRNARMSKEISIEIWENQPVLQMDSDMLERLPLMQKLENQGLQSAIKEMKDKERYIFLERVLADKKIAELSLELGMEYKSVATTYYRAIEKIRRHMKEAEENGF